MKIMSALSTVIPWDKPNSPVVEAMVMAGTSPSRNSLPGSAGVRISTPLTSNRPQTFSYKFCTLMRKSPPWLCNVTARPWNSSAPRRIPSGPAGTKPYRWRKASAALLWGCPVHPPGCGAAAGRLRSCGPLPFRLAASRALGPGGSRRPTWLAWCKPSLDAGLPGCDYARGRGYTGFGAQAFPVAGH